MGAHPDANSAVFTAALLKVPAVLRTGGGLALGGFARTLCGWVGGWVHANAVWRVGGRMGAHASARCEARQQRKCAAKRITHARTHAHTHTHAHTRTRTHSNTRTHLNTCAVLGHTLPGLEPALGLPNAHAPMTFVRVPPRALIVGGREHTLAGARITNVGGRTRLIPGAHRGLGVGTEAVHTARAVRAGGVVLAALGVGVTLVACARAHTVGWAVPAHGAAA